VKPQVKYLAPQSFDPAQDGFIAGFTNAPRWAPAKRQSPREVVDQRMSIMKKHNSPILAVIGLLASLFLAGCVERKLTINTDPQAALVILNDEEIGVSPVTVTFLWYGDYWVRISKEGYETRNTHRQLKAPWYDHFPFDFFAQILYPGRIVDSYEWTFTLIPQKQPSREGLIEAAEELKKQL
jgi:hypothetical protein